LAFSEEYHVSNAEVLQRSGLSPTGDIRHRRLSLFGHVARLESGEQALDALRLMADTFEGRKPMSSWRRPPGHPRNNCLAQQGSGGCQRSTAVYAVI